MLRVSSPLCLVLILYCSSFILKAPKAIFPTEEDELSAQTTPSPRAVSSSALFEPIVKPSLTEASRKCLFAVKKLDKENLFCLLKKIDQLPCIYLNQGHRIRFVNEITYVIYEVFTYWLCTHINDKEYRPFLVFFNTPKITPENEPTYEDALNLGISSYGFAHFINEAIENEIVKLDELLIHYNQEIDILSSKEIEQGCFGSYKSASDFEKSSSDDFVFPPDPTIKELNSLVRRAYFLRNALDSIKDHLFNYPIESCLIYRLKTKKPLDKALDIYFLQMRKQLYLALLKPHQVV